MEDLSLYEVELIQFRAKMYSFNSKADVCVRHKTRFIKDLSHGFRKCEDPLGIQKSVIRRNLHEVTLEEYKLICQN